MRDIIIFGSNGSVFDAVRTKFDDSSQHWLSLPVSAAGMSLCGLKEALKDLQFSKPRLRKCPFAGKDELRNAQPPLPQLQCAVLEGRKPRARPAAHGTAPPLWGRGARYTHRQLHLAR